jgi:hypothetical protein
LVQSAFEFLADGIDELDDTEDPVANVGVEVFRRLVVVRSSPPVGACGRRPGRSCSP